MTIVESITFAIALIGATLGIVNTWNTLNNSRIKLKVIPGHAIPVGNGNSNISFYISVTNLSSFPVTVNEVGVSYRNSKLRSVYINPILNTGDTIPKRLESRSSVTAYGEAPKSIDGKKISKAYVKTDCGKTVFGTSPALRQIAKEV